MDRRSFFKTMGSTMLAVMPQWIVDISRPQAVMKPVFFDDLAWFPDLVWIPHGEHSVCGTIYGGVLQGFRHGTIMGRKAYEEQQGMKEYGFG